jgi:peptidoglycan/LPS O-acetylase OafA/YrhL
MDYRREIDGLRALAVLPVIFFHAGFSTFSGGFVGVDIFFVISGYLITSIILAEMQAGTFTLANFYERRARRILPALFVLMALSLPFAWLWLLPQDLKSFSQSLVAVSAFASNVLFWQISGYFDTAAELKPLLHTWSLAVEEQYYLLFPLFLLFTWRFGKIWILKCLVVVFIISLVSAHWGSNTHPLFTFYLLPTRGWELLIGGFIAFYFSLGHKQPTNKWGNELGSLVGVLSIALSIFLFDSKTPFPSLYTLVPTLGAALVIFFTTPQTSTGKLLGSKLLVGVGLISYSAYLYHQPLFAFAKHRSIEEPNSLLIGLLLAATFLLAYFSWKFVEAPFRNKQLINRKKLFIFSILASTAFSLFGLVGYFSNGNFNRTLDSIDSLLSAAANEMGKNSKCWEKIESTQSLGETCLLGSLQFEKTFAIIGDSHAGALVEELSKAATNLNLAGYDFTYNGCPPLQGGKSLKQDSVQVVCNSLREDFFKRMEQRKLPSTLVLLARWTLLIEQERFDNKEGGIEVGEKAFWVSAELNDATYFSALKTSYSNSIRLMLNNGHKVILIYPVPEMGWDVPRRLSRIYSVNNNLIPVDASTSHEVFQSRNARAYEALDAIGEHPNLIRVKPENILCDTFLNKRCTAHISNKPLYSDDDHLSNEGAKLVVKEIIQSLKN